MTTFIALLRAINVGGTGKLPMKDLASLCEQLDFKNVRTYIQSGNVLFRSPLREEDALGSSLDTVEPLTPEQPASGQNQSPVTAHAAAG